MELTAAGRIDRYLNRAYERLGARYLRRLWRVTWVAFLLGAAAGTSALAPYLHPSVGQFLGLLGLAELGVIAMMLIAGRVWLSRERVFSSWWKAGRPVDGASRVWKVVVGLRVAWLFGWPLGLSTLGIPTTIYSLTVLGRSVGEGGIVFATWVGGGAYAALLGFFTVDVWVRPILHDAAARMPASVSGKRARVPIGRRLFAALLMISGSTGFFLSFGLSIGAGSFNRLVIGFALTAGFTLTTALLCTVMITGSTAGPVDELLAVMGEVRAGRLDVRVPVSSPDELGLLTASFNEMTVELQRSQARIVASADAERRRVERDLHDGAQQHLVLLKLKVSQLVRSLEHGPDAARLQADELGADLDRALAELRDLARGIYPPLLESDGLPAALTEAAQRAAIPTTVDCEDGRRYPRDLEAAVYFCCMEALQNAAKHAGEGARARVRLVGDAGVMSFEVVDDGCGFDPQTINGAAGLGNMKDRIGALGGSLQVDSTPGQGTTVAGRVPI
jgi:signal transduction histidine kinase